MNNISSLLHTISQGEYDSTFSVLYHEDSIAHQRERYTHLLELFAKTFPDSDTPRLFSAPGRTEISGNHTDHQHGCVDCCQHQSGYDCCSIQKTTRILSASRPKVLILRKSAWMT